MKQENPDQNAMIKWKTIESSLTKVMTNLMGLNLITNTFDTKYGLLNEKYSTDNYGPMNDTIIPLSPTQTIDYETDDESEYGPTIRDVTDNLYDLKLYQYVDTLKKLALSKSLLPGIIIYIINDNNQKHTTDLNVTYFNDLVKKHTQAVVNETMIISNHQPCITVIKFSSLNECQEVKRRLSQETTYLIRYGYDISDLKDSMWFCVVLRNLPFDKTEKIKELCQKFLDKNKGVKYVVKAKTIKNQICAYVIMDDLERAENLCRDLKFQNVKVNLHPKCCKIREDEKHSHFFNFFNFNFETYTFN